MIKCFVVGSFVVHVHLSKCWRGTCLSVRMLKGYMVRERLGTPELEGRTRTKCRVLFVGTQTIICCEHKLLEFVLTLWGCSLSVSPDLPIHTSPENYCSCWLVRKLELLPLTLMKRYSAKLWPRITHHESYTYLLIHFGSFSHARTNAKRSHVSDKIQYKNCPFMDVYAKY